MTDALIIRDLPILQWRGLTAPPYITLNSQWQNGLAPRNVPYVDGDLHDPLGRRSFTFSTRLLFLNTVKAPTATRNFPEYWERWREQILDGEPGDLRHPVLGLVRARVEGGAFAITAESVSGIAIDISWVETNEDPSTLVFFGDVDASPSALAAKADASAARVGVTFAPKRSPQVLRPQYGLPVSRATASTQVTTLSEVVDSIQPRLFSLDRNILSTLDTFAGDVSTMVSDVDLLNRHDAWVARSDLVRLYLAIVDSRSALSRVAGKTRERVVSSRTTLARFAREMNNTLTEILALNIRSLYLPYVERGDSLLYYVRT